MDQGLIRSLLAAKPEHERTSCSDDRPVNWYTTPGRGGYPRCNRCALLKAMVDEEFSATLTLDFNVTMPPE